MALKLNMTLDPGTRLMHTREGYSDVVASSAYSLEAYVRVTRIVHSKRQVAVYPAALEEVGGTLRPVANLRPVCFVPDTSPTAPEIMSQAYQCLKQQPQYYSATDC